MGIINCESVLKGGEYEGKTWLEVANEDPCYVWRFICDTGNSISEINTVDLYTKAFPDKEKLATKYTRTLKKRSRQQTRKICAEPECTRKIMKRGRTRCFIHSGNYSGRKDQTKFWAWNITSKKTYQLPLDKYGKLLNSNFYINSMARTAIKATRGSVYKKQWILALTRKDLRIFKKRWKLENNLIT